MALGVHHDFAKLAQFNRAFEPLGVGNQANLHKHAFQVHQVIGAGGPVLETHAVDFTLRTGNLRRLGVGVDGDVGQALELVHQHRVRLELVGKLHQRYVGHDAGQVNGSLYARVAATDHRRALALEQGAVAMRAIGHTLVFVLGFAGHIDIAPARASRQDDGLGLQAAAVGQHHFGQAAGLGGGHQFGGLLQVHDVHAVGAGLGFHGCSKLGAIGFEHRDVVLNRQGVVHLPAKARGHHTHANAFARRVHRCGRAGRATADDQHVERVFRRQLGGVLVSGARVELGHDLFHQHAAVAKQGAVQVNAGHGHDFARVYLVLKGAAFDHRGLDERILNGHQAQGLHHVRAVVAGQAHVDLKIEVAARRGPQGLDLLNQVLLYFGRMTAGPQKRQHQRGKFMAQRQPGKAQAGVRACALERKRGLARVLSVVAHADFVAAQTLNCVQQFAHFDGIVVFTHRRHDLHRERHAL